MRKGLRKEGEYWKKSEKKEMQLSPDGKQAGQAQINKIKMKSEETKPAYRYINEKSPRKLGYACVTCLCYYSTVSATSFSLSIVQYTHTHVHTHTHIYKNTFSLSLSLCLSLSLPLSLTHTQVLLYLEEEEPYMDSSSLAPSMLVI